MGQGKNLYQAAQRKNPTKNRQVQGDQMEHKTVEQEYRLWCSGCGGSYPETVGVDSFWWIVHFAKEMVKMDQAAAPGEWLPIREDKVVLSLACDGNGSWQGTVTLLCRGQWSCPGEGGARFYL